MLTQLTGSELGTVSPWHYQPTPHHTGHTMTINIIQSAAYTLAIAAIPFLMLACS